MIMIAGHWALQNNEAQNIQKGVLCGCLFHKDHTCVCSSLSVMNDMAGFRRNDGHIKGKSVNNRRVAEERRLKEENLDKPALYKVP